MGKSKYIGSVIHGFEIVDSLTKESKNGKRYSCFEVKCLRCGRATVMPAQNVKRGTPCVCASDYHTHGQSKTRLYKIYHGVKTRLYDKNCKAYKDYGGRGIKMCDEWLDFLTFQDWAISNGYTDELTLDRENTNGDYCPENCRWITLAKQQNNRRNNRFETIDGETRTLAEWARMYGVNYSTLQTRLSRGMGLIDALTKK